MHVIIITDPDGGKPIAAIKNVGSEEAWEVIGEKLDGHEFSDPVPLYETPDEFVEQKLGGS